MKTYVDSHNPSRGKGNKGAGKDTIENDDEAIRSFDILSVWAVSTTCEVPNDEGVSELVHRPPQGFVMLAHVLLTPFRGIVLRTEATAQADEYVFSCAWYNKPGQADLRRGGFNFATVYQWLFDLGLGVSHLSTIVLHRYNFEVADWNRFRLSDAVAAWSECIWQLQTVEVRSGIARYRASSQLASAPATLRGAGDRATGRGRGRAGRGVSKGRGRGRGYFFVCCYGSGNFEPRFAGKGEEGRGKR